MSSLAAATGRIKRWRADALLFAVEAFAFVPDRWQEQALRAASRSDTYAVRICLKACTGPGKTAVLAILGWWRLLCFADRGEHPKGAALSITRENLKDNLWSELAKWQKRSEILQRAFTWTKEQIYANDHASTWFLSARSFAKDANEEAIGNALSGLHSRFPFILLDEIGDMPPIVGQKAEQIFTGGVENGLIAGAGNPTSTSGLLYHLTTTRRDQFTIITITADPDDPNRTPRVPVELAREQIALYGRDNPWVMATILGLFPTAGFNALLGVEQVEAAMKRFYRADAYEFSPRILGVDVAREGDDQSVIFPRQGLVAFRPKSFRNAKSTDLAGQIALASDKWHADGTIVDGTGGWGSGVIDALTTMKREAFDCQFAGKPFLPKFANKRAEIWWEMAEWVKGGGALPNVPQLVAELTTPTYSYQGDKILIEPKEQVKKRLGRSPDFADALAVTFAFPIAKRQHPPLAGRDQITQDYDPIQRGLATPSVPVYSDHDPFSGRD